MWVSEQYPTQEWHFLAVFEAENRRRYICASMPFESVVYVVAHRGVTSVGSRPQTFVIDRDDDWYRVHYFKYVKVEFRSHWDDEHYCPLTQFKVQGMTMYEDWMAENSLLPRDPELASAGADGTCVLLQRRGRD